CTIAKWVAEFKDRIRGFEDAPRSGRTSITTTDENIEAVERILMRDRQISVCPVADDQFNDKYLSNGTKMAKSSLLSLCMSILRQLIQLTKESIYFQVLENDSNRFDRIKIWKKQVKIVCSNNELKAYYCERNNLEKFKSCQIKEKF
ncbi:unnamed protein product, partial [Didymodactylos carnosus]